MRERDVYRAHERVERFRRKTYDSLPCRRSSEEVAMKLNDLSPQALRAAMRGGTEAWGTWGSATEHLLYVEPINPPKWLGKCRCGCRRRITHAAKANGIGLYFGCELSVRRWVKRFSP